MFHETKSYWGNSSNLRASPILAQAQYKCKRVFFTSLNSPHESLFLSLNGKLTQPISWMPKHHSQSHVEKIYLKKNKKISFVNAPVHINITFLRHQIYSIVSRANGMFFTTINKNFILWNCTYIYTHTYIFQNTNTLFKSTNSSP